LNSKSWSYATKDIEFKHIRVNYITFYFFLRIDRDLRKLNVTKKILLYIGDLMNKFVLSVAAAATLSACATTSGPQTYDFKDNRDGVKVAVMPLDVEVTFAKVGSRDVRADWTEEARQNLETSLVRGLEASGEDVVKYATSGSDEQAKQLTLLQQHVAQAINAHVVLTDPAQYRGPLPHKKGENKMTYNLGSGVQSVKAQTNADYAAFLTNRTVVESGGSVFAKIAIGAVTGYAPGLSSFKGTSLSLVDLNTGEVKWLNSNLAGLGGDPRNPENADKIVGSILKKSPFNDEEEG